MKHLKKNSDIHWPAKPDRTQEAVGQCSQTLGLNFGQFFVKPGVELNDLCGSLTAQGVLWFCDTPLSAGGSFSYGGQHLQY